ncbi:hypothetical protein O181_079777 [Austropuccinia psidii MF-1]|uniref:Uncharacterized protein n=1 Tax=Austropuccinia psidii MF-1 TaxID=1389203 RepID=A0A9Q3FMQ2_9BASI|nr:hypothetical protein [Austropuccinia psidii MF-1]
MAILKLLREKFLQYAHPNHPFWKRLLTTEIARKTENSKQTTTKYFFHEYIFYHINPSYQFYTPQSNDLPYSLPSTIVKPPVPSTIPLETPTIPPFITEEDIPKHTPNFTPRRSSQHESHHFNNDQSLEVPANSIPNSPAQVHPLTPTNEIIQELHFSIVENNSSPKNPSQIPSNTTTPINAITPHVVLSQMQINHAKSSHKLSAPHFENPESNLLTSQSNLSTPSHAPSPGITDPFNHLSHVGPSSPILHETHRNPPSSLIPL